MIVWQRLLAVGQLDATVLEIDAGDLRAHDAGAMQAAAQRRGNMCRLQAAGGHFGQHRGKKERVGFTDERECNTWIVAKFFLQVHGRAHPRETAAEDDDARFYLW